MSDNKVYLSLGSNLGNRLEMLKTAVKYMQSRGLAVEKKSRVWETPPWGLKGQPPFLNMCISAWTGLEPFALLRMLKNIEADMGRSKTIRWGPREIDIDIILFGSLILNDQKLTIPHPHMHERAFVLKPLAEIAPDAVHPTLRADAATLLGRLPSSETEGMVWISEI